MKILLDIDGVVRDWANRVVEVISDKFPDSDIAIKPDYDISTWSNMGADLWMKVTEHFVYDIYTRARSIDEAWESLLILNKNGHEIWFVSDQPTKTTRMLTTCWLDLEGFYFDGLIYTKNKYLIDGDVFVDDCTGNLNRYYMHNARRWPRPQCIAFDQPWNQDWKGKRAKDWPDLLKQIEEINQERTA